MFLAKADEARSFVTFIVLVALVLLTMGVTTSLSPLIVWGIVAVFVGLIWLGKVATSEDVSESEFWLFALYAVLFLAAAFFTTVLLMGSVQNLDVSTTLTWLLAIVMIVTALVEYGLVQRGRDSVRLVAYPICTLIAVVLALSLASAATASLTIFLIGLAIVVFIFDVVLPMFQVGQPQQVPAHGRG